MSIQTSTSNITTDLVFNYDASNVKSYAGPPLQNILTQITPAGAGTSTGYSVAYGSETVNIPSLGDTFVNFVTIQNTYTAYTPNSANCCPSLYYYGAGTLLPSTVYTYAIVYKCDSGYTGPNFMYQYNYNGGTYVTEFGLHSTGQRTHLGGGWYWAWATFTTGATVNTLQNSGLWYYQYSTGVDKVTVAKAMIVQGNYTTLHPKYWPAVNTTRAGTSAFSDMAQIPTSLTPANLTYGTDGVVTYNGSTSYVDCGNPTALQLSTQITIEAVVYPTSFAGLGNIVAKNGNSAYRFRLDSTSPGALWWYVSGNAIQGGSTPLNTWGHLTVTGNAQGLAAYINGVLVASTATAYTPTAAASGNVYIGCLSPSSETFAGKIDYVKIYSRALTATEVAKNFNAVRRRYSL